MRYWNKTDYSVVIDADGRAIDGGAYMDIEDGTVVSKEIGLAIRTKRLIPVPSLEEAPGVYAVQVQDWAAKDEPKQEPDDTNVSSAETSPEPTTLSPKAPSRSRKQRTTKKEN